MRAFAHIRDTTSEREPQRHRGHRVKRRSSWLFPPPKNPLRPLRLCGSTLSRVFPGKRWKVCGTSRTIPRMKKILVGLDGSPRSQGVLDAALALAKLVGAKVFVVRAIGLPPAMPPHVWALEEASLIDALRHDAEKYLAEVAKKV